jgi:ligand-binding sensor domain-containing protein
MHGLADYWVYSFGEQRDGTMWIGTWAGVSKLVKGEERFTNYVKELVNEWVYGMAVDREDRVWFATEGGVSVFDGHQWRTWTHAEGLGAPNTANLPPSDNTGLGTRARHDLSVIRTGQDTYNPGYAFCVMEAKNGEMWVGTWGAGVSRFDGLRWHNLTTQEGLASNIVFSLIQDQDGVFWFGTQKGLSRYDGHAWEQYNREDGLYDQSVYALASTDDGSVWVGTRSGVVRMAKKTH